jgi:hypothetical protein
MLAIDLQQVGGFIRFPPAINFSTTIYRKSGNCGHGFMLAYFGP